MKQSTSSAPALSPLNGEPILMNFDGVEMSSDAGLTLLREIERSTNCATLRRITLNIIKANPAKGSNRGKFKKAGWSNEFLKTLIQGF